jgi:hypothetical protein
VAFSRPTMAVLHFWMLSRYGSRFKVIRLHNLGCTWKTANVKS